MIDYGNAPAKDEIEVTLFGPGYGEAIAVHLGGGGWLLVDSCVDPNTGLPASVAYLEEIGVGPDKVHTIVASHWHDDHVRGIAQLAAKYSAADFVISAVLNDKEALTFLSAYNGRSSSGLARGTKELYSVVHDRATIFHALHKSLVIDDTFNGRPIRVTALSPLQAAFAQCIAHLAQHLPKNGEAINHAPELHPNLEAIVLHIDLGDDAILLGSDLEDHGNLGWTALVADQWSGSRIPATAYKVAHHGSYTGDCSQVWEKLLQAEPVACLTPYTLAGRRLPTDTDKERLRGNTSRAYTASGASRSPKMDTGQLKRLRDMSRAKNVLLVDSEFGAVRFRKEFGSHSWNVKLFGAAQKL
jgi:beta-lactamase superfamily II metal-dependent hydrolase